MNTPYRYLLLYFILDCVLSSEKDLKFWQITDIHWDLDYSDNGDKSEMCHTDKSTNDKIGTYGEYECDSPFNLVLSAISALKKINPNPEFVLWTGDNAPHTEDPQPDFSVIFRTTKNITGMLKDAFDTPILPVLGNHDAYPVDYFPALPGSFYKGYLTEGGWNLVLSEEAQLTFQQGGYYKFKTTYAIVLIVNTNLYYAFNKLGTNEKDPCGQFAWIRNELENARASELKVIVAAHSPPGFYERFAVLPFLNESYNDAYVELFIEYGDVIMSHIYGHEHSDSFKIFADENSHSMKTNVAFIAPSLTPWKPSFFPYSTAINPSVREYVYNSSVIVDYIQYNLNLNNANSGHPDWKVYYRAKDFFQVKTLSAENVYNFYKRLIEDDDLFQKYYAINSAGVDNGYCDKTCKKNHICAIYYLKINSLLKCMSHGTSGNRSTTPHIAVALTCIVISLTLTVGIIILIFKIKKRRIASGRRVSEWWNNSNGYRQF